MNKKVTEAIERSARDESGSPRVGTVAIPAATLREWVAMIHRELQQQWEVGYEAGYAWGREDKRPYVKPDGSVGR
jgi:hypothetical protein